MSPATLLRAARAPADSAASGAAPSNVSQIFRGRTVEEVIPRIQAELGRDAIVLRRETGLTGGIAGFFQRPFVEIEARRSAPGIDRYDEEDAKPALPSAAATPPVAMPEHPAAAAQPTEAPATLDAHTPFPAARPRVEDALSEDLYAEAGLGVGATPAVDAAEDFRELTAAELATDGATDPFALALAEAEAAVDTPRAAPVEQESFPAPAPLPVASSAAPSAPSAAPVARSRARDSVERTLLGIGFDEQAIRELLEAATAHVLPTLPPRTSLAHAVQRALAQRIPRVRALPTGNATIAVIGPGGSGKTTFCAALLDAYEKRSTLPALGARIVAHERRGGRLALLADPRGPQSIALEGSQARAALRAAREAGVVVLDTPALSCAEPQSIATLGALLGELRPDRIVLTLPATLGAKPAAQLLEALRPLAADTLAITHHEETDQLGVAVAAACAFDLAPTYLLGRGRAGAALTQLDPAELAERLLG
jgi:flagellar biosynthesis GTPase FlhF